MADIKKLVPGQILYSVTRQKMGNTTISTTSVHDVRIIEVHETHVVASWNGNRPERRYPAAIKSWKVNKPVLVRSMSGRSRLENRVERKARLEQTRGQAVSA